MSVESQLRFDISRCSSCPLGANRLFYAPVFQSFSDTLLVLESPNLTVCEQENPWKHSNATTLSRMISHASGADLSRFHLTFLLKCWTQIDGSVPPMRHRKAWAQECAQHYLEREIEGLPFRQIILFGEFISKVCLPELEEDWEAMQTKSINWGENGIQVHCLEHPRVIQKQGLDSEIGRKTIERLHGILGGRLSLPDSEEPANLFDLFED